MSSWEESRRRVGAQYEEMERQRRLGEQYKHENDWMKPRSGSGSRASGSGSSGGSYTGPAAAPIPTGRIIAIFLALALIVAGVSVAIGYNSYYNGEWTYATPDRQSGRSAEEYRDYLLSLDTEHTYWHVTYESAPTDLWNYLLGLVDLDKAVGYAIGGYNVGGGHVYDYHFEGDDAGTGIPDGRYTLTTLDGIRVLVDEDNKTIYKEGAEFYDTYAPKLLELTHDQTLAVVLERTSGGEHALHGTNDFWMEYIRRDDSMVYSYLLSEDETKISGGEFRAITLYPQEQREERWYFTYGNGEYTPEDWAGFVYADDTAFQTNDALGKLIQKSFDDFGNVEFFKNGESVLEIDVFYLANGYDFEIDGVAEGYGNGLEEDMVYRVNTTAKTLTKIANEGDSDEVQEEMPLSEHQALYDFLLSIVPHTYIRSIMDMDRAAVRKETLGLITVYEMKDENGKVTADLRIMFGVIGEVNHYKAEDEYVKIQLEY